MGTTMTEKLAAPEGRVGLWQIPDNLSCDGSDSSPRQIVGVTTNTALYKWGFAAAKALGEGDMNYRINAMYIEYENVTLPGNTVTVPSFTRDEGLSYYTGLSSSSVKDYLRLELNITPSITIESGYESYFTSNVDGNLLTFFRQSAGTQGEHTRTFSDSVNSKIYGAALVVAPDFSDSSQDIVFARAYFAEADQTLKQASSQVGVTWELPFA
jgi:stage V sporulation protein SpoVS